MALTIEDLLTMQAAPRQAVSADVPGILAAMMANRQQGMPELPNMPAPIQPIALPSLGDGGGHGGGGAGLAQQAISSLMGEYFKSRADEKQTKAESEQAKLLAQYAPQLYDERIAVENDPRARAQLKADRAAWASGNSILAKTGVKNYEAYLTSRMPDINASETIKNVRAQGYDLGTPEFQAGMKQELQQKNAPTGMYRNERGELAFSPLAGGGTYQDIQDRISPLERARLAISQSQSQRQSVADERAAAAIERQNRMDIKNEQRYQEGKLQVMPAVQKSAYAGNQATIKQIDDAISLLDKRPESVGLQFGVSEALNQRIDPEGVKIRAAVANVGAVKRHDMSGAAISASEAPYLKPFIPSVNDTAEAAKAKLEGLKAQISGVNSEIEGAFTPDQYKGLPWQNKEQEPKAPQKPQLTKEQALEMLKKNGARFQ